MPMRSLRVAGGAVMRGLLSSGKQADQGKPNRAGILNKACRGLLEENWKSRKKYFWAASEPGKCRGVSATLAKRKSRKRRAEAVSLAPWKVTSRLRRSPADR